MDGSDMQFKAVPTVPLEKSNNPQPVIIVQTPLGPDATRMTCPYCHKEILTEIKKDPSTGAYLAGFCLCLFGCWLGCCLIPCCMDSCMNTRHYCPHCKQFLGDDKV